MLHLARSALVVPRIAAARYHAFAFQAARDPSKLKYSQEHEWVDVSGDVATVGITGYAAQKLGEIVHVELAAVGEKKDFMESFGVLDSTKAVSDVYAPVAGEIVAVNAELDGAPANVSSAPLDEGWLVKIKMSDKAGLAKLMDLKAYEKLIKDADH